MLGKIAARVLALVPILFGMSVIAFLLLRLVPGDIVNVMMVDADYDVETVAALRRMFGLDQPLPVQFWEWFTALIRGDMGSSLRSGQPVLWEIGQKFPATLQLTLASLLVSLSIGIPIGVLSAVRRGGVLDFVARTISIVGLSMPHFWLGILLILFFAVTLRVLPAGGYVPPSQDLVEHLRHLAMPALTLGTALATVIMRMTRSSMLEVLNDDYVRTARAKGLAEPRVIVGHVLRNAFVPIITVLGIQAGHLLAGAVVVEQVFSWPGLGTTIVRAIFQRDYPLVQGAILFLSVFFVAVNLLVDIAYLYLDPRLRRG